MLQNKFYSSSIASFQDFKDYVEAKGYKGYSFAEIPNNGYFVMLKIGTSSAKDFTQVNLGIASVVNVLPVPSFSKFEWVYLSFQDCTNTSIINS
jgi:hypothetical protein